MPCFLAGVGGEIGDLHFSLDANRRFSSALLSFFKRVRVAFASVGRSRGDFTRLTVKITAFAEKSHHTPFSTLPPPLKCVAMLRCVTYSILLQRSSAVYR